MNTDIDFSWLILLAESAAIIKTGIIKVSVATHF